jgi:uncharacterized protein YdhG (YjbR/CyaY superfamily)
MAKTDYKTIDEYHSNFSANAIERMQTIRQIVHKVVPEVEETISYQIPCFKHHGYLIYYSVSKNHISLLHPFSEAFLKNFEIELKNYKVSKSAIQLPNSKELPVQLIERIIEFRKNENIKLKQS